MVVLSWESVWGGVAFRFDFPRWIWYAESPRLAASGAMRERRLLLK
jgi:hypothetical protein